MSTVAIPLQRLRLSAARAAIDMAINDPRLRPLARLALLAKAKVLARDLILAEIAHAAGRAEG